jgi:beta-carotene 3-hydroxylase
MGTFMGMEAIAWLTHKYIMHNVLWNLHRDHHLKDHEGFFERNDFFFLIFAIPGIVCLALGVLYKSSATLSIGVGITLYGVAYFLVHDVFIHRRFRIFRKTDNRYLQAIRRAHKMHHKHLNRENGECFGMLWVPFKYFMASPENKSK